MIYDKISNISDNIHGPVFISRIEKKIISTTLFNRLHGVYQNSTAYLTFPANRTKRVEHSFGAMYLCGEMFYSSICNTGHGEIQRFFKEFTVNIHILLDRIKGNPSYSSKLGEREKQVSSTLESMKITGGLYNKYMPPNISEAYRTYYLLAFEAVRISAVLHDVGHPPMSHICENALNEVYDRVKAVQEKNESQKEFLSIMKAYTGNHKLHEEMGKHIAGNVFLHIIPDISREEAKNQEIYENQVFMLLLKELVSSILHEDNDFFAGIHRIIDGTLDGDRLDYVTRDPLNSGFDAGKIEYRRLTDSMRLCYHKETQQDKETMLFCPCINVQNTIEDFLNRRFNMYKYLIYHHRVVKTDHLLESCIIELALNYLHENHGVCQKDENVLPYDISGLWKAIQFSSPLKFSYSLNQWDDAWLMTILKKYYFQAYIDENSVLSAKLTELLTNEKKYFSMIKRKEDFSMVDQEAVHAIASNCRTVKALLERCRAQEDSYDSKGYLAKLPRVFELVLTCKEKKSIGDREGFLLCQLKELLYFDKVNPIEPVLKAAADEALNVLRSRYLCIHDIQLVARRINTGTTKSLYFYRERMKRAGDSDSLDYMALVDISNVCNTLYRDINFFPAFFVYILMEGGNHEEVSFDEVRREIGRQTGLFLLKDFESTLQKISNSEEF